jgi:hypothetical protein
MYSAGLRMRQPPSALLDAFVDRAFKCHRCDGCIFCLYTRPCWWRKGASQIRIRENSVYVTARKVIERNLKSRVNSYRRKSYDEHVCTCSLSVARWLVLEESSKSVATARSRGVHAHSDRLGRALSPAVSTRDPRYPRRGHSQPHEVVGAFGCGIVRPFLRWVRHQRRCGSCAQSHWRVDLSRCVRICGMAKACRILCRPFGRKCCLTAQRALATGGRYRRSQPKSSMLIPSIAPG